LTELGEYQCFGEDPTNLTNFLLSPYVIAKKPITYSIISALPLEYYSLRKLDFYEYIDDVVRKNFTLYLRGYPADEDLRRFYYEQSNWMDFRHVFKQERLHTPVQI
jgi:hypothetical protein